MTDQQIGRAIGRNSSLVYQVRAGRKPGRNLERSLLAVEHGGRVPPPPPRQSRRGEPARVRSGRRQLTPSGRLRYTFEIRARQADRRAFDKTLHMLGNRNAWVSLEITFDEVENYEKRRVINYDQTVELYSKGGRSARILAGELDGWKSPSDDGIDVFLSWIARQRPDIIDARGPYRVVIYVV